MGDGLPEVGNDLAGYVIVREIARGGMGVIFLVRHPRLPRIEALKILLNPAGAERAPDRFRQEMELVATLDHPAILPVLTCGESDGRLWFTMPFVDGIDAATLLDREGALPVPTVLTIVDNVAAALDHAHDSGIVHRDVKPGNILLRSEPTDPRRIARVYLTDFGIAKVAEGDIDPLTSTSEAYGTWQYAAPEQFDKRPVDRRTDVYALGAVLFHLLTGAKPFPVHDFMANVALRAQGSQPAVTALRPDLPPAIDAVVRRAMALEPGDRHPTAGEVAEAVRFALLTRPRVRSRSQDSFAPTVAGTPTASQRPLAAPRSRRRAFALAAALVVLLTAVGVGTWLTTRTADAQLNPSGIGSTTTPASSSDYNAYVSSLQSAASSAAALLPTPITGLITPAPTVQQVTVADSVDPAAVVLTLAPRSCTGDSSSVTLHLEGRFSTVSALFGLVDGAPDDVRTGLWIDRDGSTASATDPDYRLQPGQPKIDLIPVQGVRQLTLTFRTLGSGDCSITYSAAFTELIGTP